MSAGRDGGGSKGEGARWLKGCGIGCGAGCALAAVAVIGLVIAVTLFFRSTFEGVGRARESQEELTERLGAVEDFVPPADGSLDPERLARFVEARESLAEARSDLGEAFRDFPPREVRETEDGWRKALAVMRSLGDLVRPLGEYADARNRALLEAEMGLGEYVWLYGLCYYSFLGHAPEDGPLEGLRISMEGSGDVRVGSEEGLLDPDRTRRRYRAYTLGLLRRQLEALDEDHPEGAADGWRAALEEEIARFESRPGRVAWGDGLPAALASSLEPWRERLEATYSEAANPLEIPTRDGDW